MNRTTFSLDTGSAMASSLQKAIAAKLSEFMGDYTDDILAQYILVLVAHGKQKSQAVKDLEAFLGDRSEDFVSWLWDYLYTNNLNDSVLKVGMSKMEPVSTERGKVMVKEGHDTQHEKQLPIEDSKLNAKALPDVDALPTKEGIEHGRDKVIADERSRSHHPPKRSRSPHHCRTHKEKTAPEVEHHHKRHLPPPRVNATRRLLQSAVRDAVAPAPGYTKCGSKRLRSVISTEIESAETLEDTNKKQTCEDIARIDDIRQAEVVIPHISEDVHAVAPEKDMTAPGAHGQGSVWDRLGKVTQDRGQAFDNRRNYSTLTKIENSKFIGTNLSVDPDRVQKRISSKMQERLIAPSKVRQSEHISEQTTLSASTNGLYEGHYSVNKGTDSNYLNRKEPAQQLGEVDQLEDIKSAVSSKISDPGLSYPSQKIAKIVSVKAPKSESCEALDDKLAVIQDIMDHTSRASASGHVHAEAAIQQGARSDSQKDILELKDRMHRVQLEMTKLRAKQPQGSDPAHKAQEGPNRPTVFVTNIHFAASKELVMAHFSQCGDVANIVMLMDGVSGQPKGSAYIEFRTQSAAEKALSLNETSFYSRILKVVRKDMEETSSVTTTTAQHSNSVMLRNARGRFSGGSSSTFSKFTHYGSPTKLQWRREGTPGPGTSPQVIGKKQNPISKNFNRSFSYTRSVPTTATSEMLKGSSQVCILADQVKTEEKA